LEKVTVGASPHWGAFNNEDCAAAMNAVDLGSVSLFQSAFRYKDIPHARNCWLGYDFRARRIVPTHYTIRTHGYGGPSGCRLKPWPMGMETILVRNPRDLPKMVNRTFPTGLHQIARLLYQILSLMAYVSHSRVPCSDPKKQPQRFSVLDLNFLILVNIRDDRKPKRFAGKGNRN
jgi:hypothetical protein